MDWGTYSIYLLIGFEKQDYHLRHDSFRNVDIFKICPSAGTSYDNSYYMEYWLKGIF